MRYPKEERNEEIEWLAFHQPSSCMLCQYCKYYFLFNLCISIRIQFNIFYLRDVQYTVLKLLQLLHMNNE